MPRSNGYPAGPSLVIPEEEIHFRASRSGGPGGQHVNTSSTRAELRWNVLASRAPTEDQRARLLERLARRLDGRGWLRVVESGSRSQARNREVATERLLSAVAKALERPKPRRKTRIPPAVRERRLEEKRKRSALKRLRKPAGDHE